GGGQGEPVAGRDPQGSGGSYRVGGLLVAVIALVAAAVIVLLLSGRSGAAVNHQGGQGAPGAGAGERNLAAAWVAGQVSRAAVVACDPVTCRPLPPPPLPSPGFYPPPSA